MSTANNDNKPGTELAELQYIAHIVSRSDDAESRIQDILRYLDERGGLARGRVLLADLTAGEIYIRYAHGLTADELEDGRYRFGEGVCGRVFQAGEPALAASPRAAPSERPLARDTLSLDQIAFVAVPIVRDDLPIGVLAAERRPEHRGPAECDLALLEVVASLITEVLSADGEAPAWVPPVWIEPAAEHPRLTLGDPDAAARDLMLRMARQRHTEGRLYLAADLYLRLAEEHPGTEESLVAKSKLLEIAGYHESKGNPRLAAGVLDRLRHALAENGGGRTVSFHQPDPWTDDHAWPGGWDSFGGSGGIGVRIR
jgi:Nif-specific regulatory protein